MVQVGLLRYQKRENRHYFFVTQERYDDWVRVSALVELLVMEWLEQMIRIVVLIVASFDESLKLDWGNFPPWLGPVDLLYNQRHRTFHNRLLLPIVDDV